MVQTQISSQINLIKYPLTTDKTNLLLKNNQYTFLVDRKITKTNIKRVIEFLFDVKIIKINSCNLPKKKRRVGQTVGTRSRYKKVIVKLSKESKMDFFSMD